MTPQRPAVHRQPPSSTPNQKVQLTFQLFLLENARTTLEQELLSFTNKAYEEVRALLNSSFPANLGVFSDLSKGLDTKCQVLNKLTALLKDFAVESKVCVQQSVQNGMRTNLIQPLRDKRILMTDVLKFGPMLQNSLMASSIAKAVQVLGATLSHQQCKHFLISQPAAVQHDDMIWSVSSSYDRAEQNKNPSSHLKAEESEHAVFIEEKRPTDVATLPPAIIKRPEINPERPPLLLPPIQAILPEISNPKPMKIIPLMSWGREDDVQVQHQKQTSSQLLHFLRAKAKSTDGFEIPVMEWRKQPCISTVTTQRYQFGRAVTNVLRNAKTLCADLTHEVPIFRVKRVESSGLLTYTCVIATKTELWDIGDIFTEVGQADSEAQPLEHKACPNMTAAEENSQTLQCTETEDTNHLADAKMPSVNGITLPDFQSRRFEEMEVVVSHVVSPGNFYIQHADSILKLQALVTDSWKASNSYAKQNCIPDIGTKVMGWFPEQEQWCRAQVTKICGVSGENGSDGAGSETCIKVEVKKLDHGDTACLSLLNIKELTPAMAMLPLQAVQVSLANVTPVNGSDWSEEAVSWFKAMVHNRTLYARLYPQGPKVAAELFLETGKLRAVRRGASLSVRLAQNGHAKHNKLKNVGLIKSSGQLKMRSQEAEWEKHLILFYMKSRK